MRILIVGGGGREHALAWALHRSPQRPDLYIAPGNPGTARLGTNVDVAADDVAGLVRLVDDRAIDLTVVGPEQPLVAGLADALAERGHAVMGPSRAAAQLEGSKAFAKAFMARHGVPTAAHRTFDRDAYDEAAAYLDEVGAPVVVKASGLAGGKGAVVCPTLDAAHQALGAMMRDDRFGEAGDEVVVEAFMEGEEASVFALCDGERYVLLPSAQDHKRVGEGDTGPNTGGMGAYAPAPCVTGAVLEAVCADVIEPTLAGMRAEGRPYRGVLYVGLMLTANGPRVVEYNCRFGDPEAQVVLPLVADDLVDVFDRVAHGRLGDRPLATVDGAAACVVMASDGYPGRYETGAGIEGIDDAEADDDTVVFHAGTAERDGRLVTAGGRVLAVMGRGTTLAEALDRAYAGVDAVHFDGAHARRDIGRRGLARMQS